jgi:hypothetical protein
MRLDLGQLGALLLAARRGQIVLIAEQQVKTKPADDLRSGTSVASSRIHFIA